MPERLDHRLGEQSRPFPAADILQAVAAEALLVAVAASDAAKGIPPDAESRERLWLAVSRLSGAAEVANGRG